ncbi:MAG: hypothetical protein KBS72_05240 [Bacteroidales bacterium]|nr:hypothetical protein [Candidatus Cacconaster scatequi]
MNKLARLLLSKEQRIRIGLFLSARRARKLNYDPKACMSMRYRAVLHKEMNWDNPQNLIEKINWLQLNTDTSLWTRCADKYRVREYVAEKGFENCLNELYGKWDDVDSIDFDKLPNSFVLKTNHGCGEVMIVKDKANLDIKKTKATLRKWLKVVYGLDSGQTHYTHIKPCVIAEKLLIDNEDTSVSLIDYKLWCFNGVPEFFLVCHNRKKTDYSLSAFDLSWNNISEDALNQNSSHYSGADIPKPECLKELINIAKALSAGIPEVRMDFYVIDNKPIFGEMTFTTGFGSYNMDFYEKLGSKVVLPYNK